MVCDFLFPAIVTSVQSSSYGLRSLGWVLYVYRKRYDISYGRLLASTALKLTSVSLWHSGLADSSVLQLNAIDAEGSTDSGQASLNAPCRYAVRRSRSRGSHSPPRPLGGRRMPVPCKGNLFVSASNLGGSVRELRTESSFGPPFFGSRVERVSPSRRATARLFSVSLCDCRRGIRASFRNRPHKTQRRRLCIWNLARQRWLC